MEVGLGATTIVVPKNTPAIVSFDGTPHGVIVQDEWEEIDGEYVLSGEGPEIRIAVSMGPGDLRLEN